MTHVRIRRAVSGVALALIATTTVNMPVSAAPGSWQDEFSGALAGMPNAGSVAWKESVAALADSLDTSRISDEQLSDFRRLIETAYVDDTRFSTAATAAEALRSDSRLVTDLQVELNTGDSPAALDALTRLLTADLVTARAHVADARVFVDARPSHGGGQALRRATDALDHAVDRWDSGQPTAVDAALGRAVDEAWEALEASGVYSLDSDVDSDGDGLSDLAELRSGSSPLERDTDGDGLPDVFEVTRTSPYHHPANADTDGDGVTDAEEDLDEDGLSAAVEQRLGTVPTERDSDADDLTDEAEHRTHRTDPLEVDTDGDGLGDGAEVRSGTDPLVPDTDGDGVGDDADVVVTTVEREGASVTLEGSGDLAGAMLVRRLGTENLARGAGQVGAAYELHLEGDAGERLEGASVTLPVPEGYSGDPADLMIFTLDEDHEIWVPGSAEQRVDAAAGTVTAELEHFSVYALFSVPNWKAAITGIGGTCTGDGGGTGEPVLLDAAFVLDASGSMSSNDPQRLRVQASKNFVDAFVEGDKGAVVRFSSGASLLQGLTTDKAALHAALDRVGASGGTNIGAGVSVGLTELATEADPAVAQVMILLTDGVGSYNRSLTDVAVQRGVTIYTVGLGSSVDGGLLNEIAGATGGAYYPVATAADLPEVFRDIEGDAGDDGRDTDGDGLSDCLEELGVLEGTTGTVYISNPQVPDTDGDGLTDGEEAGYPGFDSDLADLLAGPLLTQEDIEKLRYWSVSSDPNTADTDGDGFDDASEVSEATDAQASDPDGDGLSDLDEISIGTDPFEADSDGDDLDDGTEEAKSDTEGYDPLAYTQELGKLTYVVHFLAGATCGDGCQMESVAWLAGSLASGYAIYGDVRDFIINAIKGDKVAAGFAALGAVPLVGDAGKTVAAIVDFMRRFPNLRGAVRLFVLNSDKLPDAVKLGVLKGIWGGEIGRLTARGVSDQTLLRMFKNAHMDPKLLDDAISGAARVAPPEGFVSTWKVAENRLRGAIGNPTKPKGMHTLPEGQRSGSKGMRWYDASDGGQPPKVFEAKSGYQRLENERIRTQIDRDAGLLDRLEIDSIEYHFYAHGRYGSLGPDRDLLDYLRDKGIPYVIHLP